MRRSGGMAAARRRVAQRDALAAAAIASSANMLVPWYLMGAYAYQVLDETLISDGLYDTLTVSLLTNWSVISHRHKHVIDLSALQSGTSSYLNLEEHYPRIVVGATHRLLLGHTLP